MLENNMNFEPFKYFDFPTFQLINQNFRVEVGILNTLKINTIIFYFLISYLLLIIKINI